MFALTNGMGLARTTRFVVWASPRSIPVKRRIQDPIKRVLSKNKAVEMNSAVELDEITCPFCGLCCDDLRVRIDSGHIDVVKNGCSLSQKRFQESSIDDEKTSFTPRVNNRTTSLDSAVDRAAEILRRSRLPVIAGLATDVSGARAAMGLADRCGAVVDHINSAGLFRNLHVLQDSGWITATLTEIRNRADLLIIIGEQIFERFPRLLERVIIPKKTLWKDDWKPMFLKGAHQRDLVVVRPPSESPLPDMLAKRNPKVLSVPLELLGELAGVLRALLRDAPLQAKSVGDVDLNNLQDLATRLKRAKFSGVIWFAGEFEFPHAELAIEAWSELVRDLNTVTRCSGLPLGGNDGDVTANQVCIWQSGYPLRTSYNRSQPHYDPLANSCTRLLASGEADALLWLSTYTSQPTTPTTNLPTIVLGHPNSTFDTAPEVFIPVGVPGIDHAGHLFRADNVVALPLKQLRQSPLPSTAIVIHQIRAKL